MVYAIIFAALGVLLFVFSVWPRRSARLAPIKSSLAPFQKLNTEIRIFNKLKTRLPMRGRRPELYLRWLGKLYIDPLLRPKTHDPVDRLMHAYALGELFTLCHDHFKRRQIYKCMLVALAPLGVVYRHTLYHARPLKLARPRLLYTVPQPHFRYMHTKFVEPSNGLRFTNSYTVETTDHGHKKNFLTVIKGHPIHGHEITGKYKFTHNTRMDKMVCNFSHTTDTFFASTKAKCIAIVVVANSRVNFETNIVREGVDLEIGVLLKHGGRVYIIETDTKQNATAIATQLKDPRRRVNYLNTHDEIDTMREIETLHMRAYMSRFITGERLKQRLVAVQKFVPTIQLPTLVYEITTPEELFTVIDNFENFKRIAWAGQSLNIVVMYSSLNDTVREYIGGFAKMNDARDLIDNNVFIFFIDKIRISNDVVYYLSKMMDASSLDFSRLRNRGQNSYIVSRKNVSYSTTDLRTCVTKYHRIKPGHGIFDMFGNQIKPGADAICVGPAYITSCKQSRSKKCTDAATTMSSFVKKSKTRTNSPDKLRVDILQ